MSDLEKRPQADDGDKFKLDLSYLVKVKEMVQKIDKDKLKEFLYTKKAKQAAAACLVGLLLISGSVYYYNYTNSAYAVKYDGKFLGYIKDKVEAEKALESVKDDIYKIDPSIKVDGVLEFEKAVVTADKLTDAASIEETIESGLYIQYASYAVVINGADAVILKSEEEANKVIEGVKKYYQDEEVKNGAEVLNVVFKDDVKVEKKVVGISNVMDVDTAISTILAGRGITKKYEVQSGDTIWDIARENDMKIEDIASINPGLNIDKLQIGQIVNLAVSEPYVMVETKVKLAVDENIPYSTNYVSDGTMYKGQTKVVEKGEYGTNKVVKEVTKVNGNVVASAVVSTTKVKDPKTQVTAKGTKALVGSGKFIWPTSGSVSSGFGSRGREYHKGLDIAAPTGTPIYAADGGTVKVAGRYYDYGLLVVIDHGNGYETYYGHCSSISVSVGQTVTRGQKIANVGRTGQATGPHVHFEVRLNGSIKNPMNYLK